MRLFVCIWPSGPVLRELQELDVAAVVGGGAWRPVPPENWHVTLRFLGDADPGEVDRLLADVSGPVEGHRCTTVRFGPAPTLLAGHVVVPVAGADALAAAVARATLDVGEPPRQRFEGHLTLARRRKGASPDRLPAVPVAGRPVDVEQIVTDVALVASHLLPDGVRYETLARYPIG